MMTFTLYRMRDRRGELLYVGQSIRLPQRMKEHRAGKEWWERVHRIDLEHFRSQEALDRAERQAIVTECPEHNKTYSCADFRPKIIPRTHPLMTAAAVRVTAIKETLGTTDQTIAKAMRAGILVPAGKGIVTAGSAVRLWRAVAPLGVLTAQLVELLRVTGDKDSPTARARALCWDIGEYMADELLQEDVLNDHMARAGVPQRFPWAMPPGKW